ncbi:MAG: hypothetical protein WAN43_13215 [Rhodomicrobium sp.]
MRILLTVAVAASLAAGTMSALAQTPPAKPAACKTLKEEAACTARTDCTWAAPTGAQKTGKCKTAPKKKS